MVGVKAELSGQNHHLNPIGAHVFEEGMTDLLLRGENRTVRSFKGREGGWWWGGGGICCFLEKLQR